MAAGTALVLAACAGPGVPAGPPPPSGKPPHGQAITDAVDAVNAALGKAAEAKTLAEFGTAVDAPQQRRESRQLQPGPSRRSD
ncbi:hypothetical protein [Kitasatospora sp. NPDC097691]|uniref:hypothetical protein n=1 Tax=Kitasatospora sp. NPDC097691 TaxID=3157231 RepID=UPI0033300CDC